MTSHQREALMLWVAAIAQVSAAAAAGVPRRWPPAGATRVGGTVCGRAAVDGDGARRRPVQSMIMRMVVDLPAVQAEEPVTVPGAI